MTDIFARHGNEIRKALAANKYDTADDGSTHLRNGSGLFFAGAMKVKDYRDGSVSLEPNLVVNQGLNHFLNAAIPPTGGYTPITQWYVAPYSGNYTPTATLTAANFTATATEFTAYDSATRLALTVATAATAQTTGNSGSEALVELSAGGPYNIYGAGIISVTAKSATTGILLAAVRFATPRLNLAGGDRLGLEYVITAGDAG